MSDAEPLEPAIVHRFRNQLSVVIAFTDLLLLEMADDDVHRSDVLEIQKAAHAAFAMMPDLSKLIT